MEEGDGRAGLKLIPMVISLNASNFYLRFVNCTLKLLEHFLKEYLIFSLLHGMHYIMSEDYSLNSSAVYLLRSVPSGEEQNVSMKVSFLTKVVSITNEEVSIQNKLGYSY